MSDPLTNTAIVTDEVELDAVPRPDPLAGQTPGLGRVGWVSTILVGLCAGASCAGFGLFLSVPLDGGAGWAAGGVGVLAGAAAWAVARQTPHQGDARWMWAIAALVVVGTTIAVRPRPDAWLDGRLALLVIAAVMVAGTGWLVRLVARVRADVRRWNTAYERLVADPRRGVEVTFDLSVDPPLRPGDVGVLQGSVRFRDGDGAAHSVPVVSMAHSTALVPAGVRVEDLVRGAVWHDPEMTIVLIRLLAPSVGRAFDTHG